MNKKSIRLDMGFALISLLSLLYMRYFESATGLLNQFFVLAYFCIAVPSFYYFIATCITIVFLDMLRLNISNLLRKTFKYFIVTVLILYILLLSCGIIRIQSVVFNSFYSIMFSILGGMFAVAVYKKSN